MNPEIPLQGGRTTQGVVRVGETVRRPMGENSSFVHQLLIYLETVQFDAAPRFLGIDGKGREVLTYFEGEVPPDLGYWHSNILEAAASIIRRFHDATAGSELAHPNEVVCHNDLSPCNTVFVGGLPRFLIDFDAAHPGSRVRDLAYAAWLWLDIGNEEIGARVQASRLRLFLKAYGWEDTAQLMAEMVSRQEELKSAAKTRGWHDTATWAGTCRHWVEKHRRVLEMGY